VENHLSDLRSLNGSSFTILVTIGIDAFMSGSVQPLSTPDPASDSRQHGASAVTTMSGMTTDPTRTDTSYLIQALPSDVLAVVRARAAADTANASGDTRRLVASGGEPLRCCLRDAAAGQRCVLFNYRPPLPASSPYEETGAVFAHADAEDCPGAPEASSGYPAEWRGRPQVLWAYDARGFIHPATRLHDGTEPEAVIAEVLADSDVVLVHSRNVAYGCYMFAISRG
jgi:hypothetical protein